MFVDCEPVVVVGVQQMAFAPHEKGVEHQTLASILLHPP